MPSSIYCSARVGFFHSSIQSVKLAVSWSNSSELIQLLFATFKCLFFNSSFVSTCGHQDFNTINYREITEAIFVDFNKKNELELAEIKASWRTSVKLFSALICICSAQYVPLLFIHEYFNQQDNLFGISFVWSDTSPLLHIYEMTLSLSIYIYDAFLNTEKFIGLPTAFSEKK